VIIHIYTEYGIEGFSNLSGPFAFALLDLRKDVLILGRDHFGERHLYYYPSKKGLFYANELKSLVDYLDIDISQISEEAMASYLNFGQI